MWNILGSETLTQELSDILKRRHYFEDMHEEREIILKLLIRGGGGMHTARSHNRVPELPFCQEDGMHSESNHNRF
jgi:hypothetical protein